MGGCSSKPQTAECHEGLLFHTGLKTSDSSAHQTLQSLFHQHARDGENLPEDAQTLHELLLHAVESKELPDFENQSTGNTESNSETRAASQPDPSASPCKLNSPISVLISHAAEKDASQCIQVEGALLNSAESNAETGAKSLESSVSKQVLNEENADKCTQTKGSMSDLAENNQEKVAQSGGLAVATDEICGKLEVTLLDLPEKTVEKRIEGDGFMSNVAEENQEKAEKLKGFVPDLTEVKLQEGCVLSKFAEENTIKLESGSSPGSLNLEPKSDLLKIPESMSSEYVEYETRGLHLGPKSDSLKIEEPNLLDSLPGDVVQQIKAPDAMENKEADLQGLNEIGMQCAIERGMQDGIAMESTDKTPKQDEKDMKCKKALQGEESEEQSGKAMEGEETEMVLGIEKDKMSHKGEKAELQSEKAMEGEPPKVQFESGGISLEQGQKAMEENTSPEKTEEAMECEKEDMQDGNALEGRKAGVQNEKSTREDEKIGVQNERAFDGEVEKLKRDEDEKCVGMEKLLVVEDEEITGVQDDKTSVQTNKAGLEDVETGTQHEERAEDEKAVAIVSPLHVKAQHEEAVAYAQPSSPGNQSFADCTHTKHDSCFEPLSDSEQPIVAMGSGPILECESKENTIEVAELGLIEKLDKCNQKKFTCKDITADVVANLELPKKLEVDQKKLVADESTIEAVGPEECSIEAVAVGELAKLRNNFKVLDDGQPTVPHSEKMLHIERHGKLEHDIMDASQHCKADERDDKKNAKAIVLEESLIEAAIANSDNSKLVQVVGEKGDDKSASKLSAKEEKKAIEPLEEQSMHEGNAKAENINIECPSKLVVENDNGDVESDEKVKMEVSAEEHGFLQKDDAEKLHIQMPIQEIDLITSMGGGSAHNESTLCPFPESSVPESNLSSPTVVDTDVEKVVVVDTSSLSAAEKECVESKPKQKSTGQVMDDANENALMEASKLCCEKGELLN